MSREEIITKLAGYFKASFRYEQDDISENTVIADTFGTNSLKRLAVCSLIEDGMDVTIPAAKFADYKTIGDLADKILQEME